MPLSSISRCHRHQSVASSACMRRTVVRPAPPALTCAAPSFIRRPPCLRAPSSVCHHRLHRRLPSAGSSSLSTISSPIRAHVRHRPSATAALIVVNHQAPHPRSRVPSSSLTQLQAQPSRADWRRWCRVDGWRRCDWLRETERHRTKKICVPMAYPENSTNQMAYYESSAYSNGIFGKLSLPTGLLASRLEFINQGWQWKHPTFPFINSPVHRCSPLPL